MDLSASMLRINRADKSTKPLKGQSFAELERATADEPVVESRNAVFNWAPGNRPYSVKHCDN